ncbi:Ribosomal RNA large subunit methyltransferase H [Prochlorococcus marinus str. MIT 1323]|nr:Ribosomal RNA large subunit methyltransferase H [Prochlorococcus marinus str. MIT 1323]
MLLSPVLIDLAIACLLCPASLFAIAPGGLQVTFSAGDLLNSAYNRASWRGMLLQRFLRNCAFRIIAVGKVRKGWIQDGLAMYQKRLPGLIITEVRDASMPREAEAIRAALNGNEVLVPLSEEGEALTSVSFAKRLEKYGSQRLAFVIGGADGLSAELKNSTQWQLSLSAMTLPHELARLLLVEQLYRAQTILQGGKYHRS